MTSNIADADMVAVPFCYPERYPTPDSKPAPTPPVATLQALIRLPDTVAQPGPLRLWPWQREIAAPRANVR